MALMTLHFLSKGRTWYNISYNRMYHN